MLRIRRILYLSTQFPTSLNLSMGVFSLNRVRALRNAGCDVMVVSPVLMTPPPNLILRPIQAYRWVMSQARLPLEAEIQGIDVFYPKWVCPPKKISGWYMSFFLFCQIRSVVLKLAEQFRPEVIVSSWLPDGIAACKLGDILNIPTLSIADGTDVNQWPQEYRGWSYALDKLNNKVSALIFVSEALRKVGNLRGLHGKKSVVLHNAVDIQLFKPGISSQNDGVFTILGVGRLVPLKGFQVLLDAFAEFSHRIYQPTRLVLVGDGPLRATLLEQAENLGICSLVEFVGAMRQEELVSYYQAADIFCLPSFTEGFPCVVVEAMACGKPVVATTVGGIAEVVDSFSGILISPGDPRILCEALVQAKNQAWDGKGIRQKIIDGFEWGKWAKTVLQLVDEVYS